VLLQLLLLLRQTCLSQLQQLITLAVMVLLLIVKTGCTARNGLSLLTSAGSPELNEAVKKAGLLCMLPTVLAHHGSSRRWLYVGYQSSDVSERSLIDWYLQQLSQ
jgi:hypothetical protein